MWLLRRVWVVLLCIFSFGLFIGGRSESFAFAPVPRIESFDIEGNQKTTTAVVIRISGLKLDEEITEDLLGEAKSKLLSASIFESVDVQRQKGSDDLHNKIQIIVKEKMTWFGAPSISFAENANSFGGVVGESDLFGFYKKGIIFGDWGPSLRRIVVAYRDPYLFETNFILSVDSISRRDDMREYIDRQQVRKVRVLERGVTVMPGYQWTDRFSTSAGIFYRRVRNTILEQNDGLRGIDVRNGNDIAARIEFKFDGTRNFSGLVEGSEITFSSDLSDNRFSSDFNYFLEIMRLTKAYLFFDHQIEWNNATSVQLGRTLPYYRELMLGGQNLRGYLDREFRGDTKYTLNEEFIFPIHTFSRFIVRGLTFWDSGIIYFKDEQFSSKSWNNGLGLGLRIYFKGIAIPLVGYDFGWGIEDKAYSTYLNIGTTF